MMQLHILLGICVTLVYLTYIQSLQVIPERAMMTYMNEKYFYNTSVFVKRHGRKSAYYFNMIGMNKLTIQNNVTLHLVFFEFLHNEYKRSFVEMHYKLCDLLKSEPYVGGGFARAGVVCPVLAGYHEYLNISFPFENFPNVWPFEKCKIEASFTAASGEIMASADVYFLFKQKLRAG